MIQRVHTSEGCRSVAVYSPCEAYRYRLTRRWEDGGALTFIMLNPSTADEKRNDPTIARCERRARDLGYPAVDIVNLFAFRATQPQVLKQAEDPEGPKNLTTLRRAAREAGCVVAAWGVHGAFRDQGPRIGKALAKYGLWALGETKEGHPRHPLYIRKDAVLQPWPFEGHAT